MGRTLYVVIDIGCHECGVGSETVGAFWSKEAADAACAARSAETKEWRDGGQSIPDVFSIEVPAE